MDGITSHDMITQVAKTPPAAAPYPGLPPVPMFRTSQKSALLDLVVLISQSPCGTVYATFTAFMKYLDDGPTTSYGYATYHCVRLTGGVIPGKKLFRKV